MKERIKVLRYRTVRYDTSTVVSFLSMYEKIKAAYPNLSEFFSMLRTVPYGTA